MQELILSKRSVVNEKLYMCLMIYFILLELFIVLGVFDWEAEGVITQRAENKNFPHICCAGVGVFGQYDIASYLAKTTWPFQLSKGEAQGGLLRALPFKVSP